MFIYYGSIPVWGYCEWKWRISRFIAYFVNRWFIREEKFKKTLILARRANLYPVKRPDSIYGSCALRDAVSWWTRIWRLLQGEPDFSSLDWKRTRTLNLFLWFWAWRGVNTNSTGDKRVLFSLSLHCVSRKQDQKDIFARTGNNIFNLEQLPTSPWLIIFNNHVLLSYIMVLNFACLIFVLSCLSRVLIFPIFFKRENRKI